MLRASLYAAVATTALMIAGPAQADSVKIGYIDPLSGAFANVGDSGKRHFEFFAEQINEAGGLNGEMVEIVAFDNKINPKESLIQLQKAIDDGIKIVVQGNGSSIASAIIDAVNKHNRRNPDEPVLFLNYAAVDPAFTNDRCSFWHFRFDADADMKMEALTDWLATRPDLEKVYVIGQDYSFGKAVQAAANRMLAAKSPEKEIVGDELHPLGKVKDFSPYIAKIKASDADVIVTGNWGTDMTLLVKAASDAGLDIPILTYYGGGLGTPTAMGETAVDRVMQVSEWHENVEGLGLEPLMDGFEAEHNIDLYYYRVKTLMEMLKKAADEAGSTEPMDIAMALRGMEHETEVGKVTMRSDNHQLIQPLYLSTFSADVPREVEGTGYGFKTNGRIEGPATATDTTCEMKLPS
ncbi:MAG: branched-chain amino acid ABC transporter substrate-binding protein [Rhodospirillales bacterium]